jgi:acetyl-CoA carboxylase biotin carboxylase subunit
MLNKEDLSFGLDLIYGLPGDSLAGYRKSLDFALSLYPNNLDLFRLSVLPGTALRDRAEELGLKYQSEAPYEVISTPEFSAADLAAAETAAAALGFPVIIKAAAGGGGKGMRIVRSADELEENLSLASREAEANFADGRVFIERYLEDPRHVELQIIADGNGEVAVLGERDCTVQKNHQKLIEESPSPAVDDAMRQQMSSGAVKMFRELKYRGAGTIEFLVEDGAFYFMEVNARVQVEHPVSEFITGTDIIRQQILACCEGYMEIDPGKVRIEGWAIECRINAQSPGTVTRLDIPGGPGVRFDSFLYTGCTVPPHYDSMVAKLIVYGPNRDAAISRMDRSLRELVIEGITTNRSQQQWIIRDKTFRSGNFGTSYYGKIAKEAESARS